MTKKELLSNIGTQVGEVLNQPAFAHIIECAREELPMGTVAADPTAIIRNEGRIQGWIACLHFIKNIGKIKAEEPPVATQQLYANPNPNNPITK